MVVCALNDVSKHVLDAENFNNQGIIDSTPTVNYKRVTTLIKETQKKIRNKKL